MITLVMIVGHKLCDRVPKRCLSEEDHSAQISSFMERTNLSANAFKLVARDRSKC
jgi:hypothetical protein